MTQAAFLPPPPPPPPPAPPPAFLPATAPTSPRRRTALLVGVGVVVLVLAIVSGGLTVWLLNRGDDGGPSADRAGGLNVMPASIDNGVSVLGEPGRVWDFEADDVVDGGRFQPIYPWSTDEQFLPTALAVGDTLVTSVISGDGEDQELVALAPDGSVRWHEAGSKVGTTCWTPDDQHLLCRDDDELRMLDPHTGRVTGSSRLEPLFGLDPVIINGVLYVVGAGSDIDGDGYGDGVTVAALDPLTLDEHWNTPVPGSADWGLSEPDGEILVDGGSLVVSIADLGVGDGRVVEVNRANGTIIGSNFLDYNDYVEGPWRINATYDEPVRVYQNGELVLEREGDLWSTRGGPNIVNGTIGINGTLYDVTTGDVVWEREDLEAREYSSFYWSEDREQVLVNGDGDVTALDATDGTTQWTYDGIHQGLTETRDAFLLSTNDPYQVLAIDRKTGETTWSRSVEDLAGSADDAEDYVNSTVYRTGPSISVIGFHKVRGYTEFPAMKGSGRTDDDDGTAYVTACGAPPEFIPTASTTKYGGVAITYTVKATCDGGQWLNHSQLSVPFLVGGYAYASGYFDFSEEPYWIPEDGEDLELVYPFENTQVPEPRFDQAIQEDDGTGKVVQVPCEPGPENHEGAVPNDPSYGADPDDPTTADGAPDESTDEDRDETALEALQRIADEDATAVGALGTNWTAQLSSKKPGTADDGKIYDSYDDILALHLQHRARYPDSWLVYSNDWVGSFGPSSQNYWVTLSGQAEATSRPILRWCQDEGWGLGDCWAKRLQHSGDPELNTDKNEPDDRNN
ncbi:PQQ-binding-like beta-propeller repeat protein [Nocardioides sp. WS12]|uniref:outer membrane protein assembly factor BamB family protein n=1 Tax=Nocardioides sp. WS12 TaxID=2486272 RepID=UPI0015FE0860|nr:PQQ-binding-like beta-propeller repeat protein [Nocardioides sp. WS12]